MQFRRFLTLLAVAAMLARATTAEAGTLAATSALKSTATAAPNSDDYAGAFADNSNKATFNSNAVPVASGVISNLEGIFAVLDSAGTTEYAFTIQGAYNSDDGPPLTNGYRLQLGFGKGANFVPAAAVVADLDFDFPQPANPALPTSISLFGITPLFDLTSHSSDTITWSGHPFIGSFFHTSLFRLPLDVPDLPASVMSYYQPGDLPSDFPAGAKAFTIRGGFVPEPTTMLLVAMAIAPLTLRRLDVRRRGPTPAR